MSSRPALILVLALTILGPRPLGAAQPAQVANGLFLVASPSLADPNFEHAVVLVTQTADGGTLGVIVNRPTELRLAAVFPDRDSLRESPALVHQGGPVAPFSLLFVFQAPRAPEHAVAVLEDVYLSGDPDLLGRLLDSPDGLERLRVYAGYAGWAPGQLMREVQRHDWLLVPATAEDLFGRDPEGLWQELSARAHKRRTSAPGH